MKADIQAPDIQDDYKAEVLNDYYIAELSREVSVVGRREVLTGKAKFGIFGAGKELPQIAMARSFRTGDWRAGYYRDQTFMFALGYAVDEVLAQLYADTVNDPFSGGRQMNNHFATPMIQKDGTWVDQTAIKNISSDISCTAGQMARGLGLATASKVYRAIEDYKEKGKFSDDGDEVCFVTIGDSSTSEGIFWEVMNAATVERVPLVVAVWDDGYGISVPVELQTTKGSISDAMEGFQVDDKGDGILIYTANGWDYVELCAVFDSASRLAREQHRPALVHVKQITQPQGHSTSGSHERYKSEERLQWEREYDCNVKMREWIIENEIATVEELDEIRKSAQDKVKERKIASVERSMVESIECKNALLKIYDSLDASMVKTSFDDLKSHVNPSYAEVIQNARRLKIQLIQQGQVVPHTLVELIDGAFDNAYEKYQKHLYSETEQSALNVPVIAAEYSDASRKANGYQVINTFFDKKFEEMPNIVAFGEDLGYIGDVNQGFAGLQEKYGKDRIWDSGIREWSIVGQAIGLSQRGLRPIAEIQYLDYILYGISPLSDDLACLRYRSNGIQAAPAIIRTRGHRLEGIWHSGSPLGVLINALRGMHILVPRNMVQAVGFYNTLLQSDDPALVIECLNGYRLKEIMPDNIGAYTLPLGVPEVLQEGSDVTLVTYGSCVRVAQEGIELLEKSGISVELIDVQSLLPFDLEGVIIESLKKTNRILFMDEDVPGGATAYMMKNVLEDQGGYYYLDSCPATLTAKAHRPPYGSDGDYFTKPNPEDVFDTIYSLVSEAGVI